MTIHSDSQTAVTRPPEIEITPEMIAAGAEVIRAEKYDLAAAQLARHVFAAMVAARVHRGVLAPIADQVENGEPVLVAGDRFAVDHA